MSERAVPNNRPSLDLSPIVLKGLESLSGSVGQIRCLPQPEQLHGLRARTEQGRAWMMAQNELVVVGIDVAKDKVDACIRSLSQRQTFPSGAEGRRKLIAWLRKHKVGSGDGGERRDQRGLGQGAARGRHRGPNRRSQAGAQLRPIGRAPRQNDAIAAEMIAWFAETFTDAPSQTCDAARDKLVQIVKARQGLLDMQTSLQNKGEHAARQVRAEYAGATAEEDRRRVAKLEAAIAALISTRICGVRRDHRERAGARQDHFRRLGRGDAGARSGEQQYRRGLVGGGSLR